jgi:murein DD-endopeptidase MepM/ murein hydrolase activator NlpD
MLARSVLAGLGLSAGLILVLPSKARSAAVESGSASAAPSPAGSGATATPCPLGTFLDGPICVHLPVFPFESPEAESAEAGHRDRHGTFQTYEQIPRRPDRPADYEAYRYPIPPGLPGPSGKPGQAARHVISGYDLDLPDEAQRRGRKIHAIGHGGLDLPQARGTPVKLLALEAQQGDAEVVYAGPLFGTTVVTRHALREGGRLRDYLVLFGHLDRVASGVAPGKPATDGEIIGFVGDTGSPELVHLHLEIRRVREGVDVTKLPPARLLDASVSVVSDPRNVLPRNP